jgi:hypothetical protein
MFRSMHLSMKDHTGNQITRQSHKGILISQLHTHYMVLKSTKYG